MTDKVQRLSMEWFGDFFKAAKTIYAMGAVVVAVGIWAGNNMVWASDLARQNVTIQQSQLENKKELQEFRKGELEDRILLLEIRQENNSIKPEERAILNRYKQRLDQTERRIDTINKQITDLKK